MDIGETSLQAQIAWFRLLAGAGFSRLDRPGALAVASGLQSNTENGAIIGPAFAGPADSVKDSSVMNRQILHDVVEWLAAREVPASVVLALSADDVVAELLALRLRPENAGNEMGAGLDALRLPAADLDGVSVSEVGQAGELAEALGVFRGDGWFDHDGELAQHVEAAERIGYGPGSPVRHWLARAGREPVGAATSFRFDPPEPEPDPPERDPPEPDPSERDPAGRRTVVLMHCCVAEPYRRRGIGTQLTRARIEAARRDGARQAVLSPSPEGYQLHRALGFTLVPAAADRWFYLP